MLARSVSSRRSASTTTTGTASTPTLPGRSARIRNRAVSVRVMRVSVGDVRLFVDVDGAKLVPDGDLMRERPTVIMLHGNGADHSPFKDFSAPFAELAQISDSDISG